MYNHFHHHHHEYNTNYRRTTPLLLEEAQSRINGAVTLEDLEAMHPIYCLLDFDKDDFCKLVDAIGIEKWTAKAAAWARLARAEEEFTAKERYLKAKARLAELAEEREELTKRVEQYEAERREPRELPANEWYWKTRARFFEPEAKRKARAAQCKAEEAPG